MFRVGTLPCSLGNPSEPLAVTDRIFKSTWSLVYVLSYGAYGKPRVRERARVTMVTRLCVRVEDSGLFRIEKSPCWLGNPSEHLAVTDWISKLTGDLVYFLYYGQYRKPRVRERMRVSMVTRLCARAERSVLFRIEKSPCWLGNPNEPLAVTDWISKFCIVQARNVAMLTWKSKCALSGDRLNFQVDMSSCVCSRLWAMQQALRARTRAGDHGVPPVCARRAFCIVQNRRVAMLAWKPK